MITILTTDAAYRFRDASYARDKNRDAHAYNGDDRTIASFDADHFVAAFQNLTDEEHAALVDELDVVDVGVVNPSHAPEQTTTTDTNTNA